MKILIAVTGSLFERSGHRTIDGAIMDLIRNARESIHLAAYRISPGAGPVLREIERAAERGVTVKMVVDRLERQPSAIRQRLIEMGKRPGLRVAGFWSPEGGSLHAKIIVADRSRALVGSANLSYGGRFGNHEIALVVEGEVAWELALLVEWLEFDKFVHR